MSKATSLSVLLKTTVADASHGPTSLLAFTTSVHTGQTFHFQLPAPVFLFQWPEVQVI